MTMTRTEVIPPVMVLYYASPLYLMNAEVGKRSIDLIPLAALERMGMIYVKYEVL